MATLTIQSLIKKGFSEKQSKIIIETKMSLNQMKFKRDEWYKATFAEEAESILKIVRAEKRPPIPMEIQNKLMYESNRCCCICKSNKDGVIIHHIIPWEESLNHKEENLVVLCSNHHAEAHVGLTKGSTLLTDKLTAKKLKEMKELWKNEVKTLKKNIILNTVPKSPGYWYYFNPNIWILIGKEKLEVSSSEYYSNLLSTDIIDEYGFFTKRYLKDQKDNSTWKSGYLPIDVNISLYYDSIIRNIIGKLEIVNLNDLTKLDLNAIKKILNEKKLFIFYGRFNFKNDETRHNKTNFGAGRIRKAYSSKKEKVYIEFIFDEYNCMSDSAMYSHLTGINKNVLLIGEARNIEVKQNYILITPTVYAIGDSYSSGI